MATGLSLLYTLSDAVKNVRENPATSVFSAFTVGVSLAIFALFMIVFVNVNAAMKTWGDDTRLTVYIKDWGLRHGAENLKDRVEAIQGVREVSFVSKENAFDILREELKGHEGVLEGVDKNVLPASLEIRLAANHINPEGVGRVVRSLREIDWVEEVEYGTEWVERFSAFVRFMGVAALGIGFFLAAATIFIISNTIRLAVYARRDEIEVMRYLGASDLFIKVPFFVEGMIEGMAGGVVALAIILLGRYVLGLYIPAYFAFVLGNPFSTPAVLAALVAGGVVIGGVGSLVSLGRFLKV